MTLTCKGCQDKIEVLKIGLGATVGMIAQESGWHPVITHNGTFLWLCNDTCYPIAHEAAKTIHKLIDDDALYFPALLR